VVGNPDREEHRGEHDGETGDEDADPGKVLCQEHFEEAKLPVPQNVSPHVGEENETYHHEGDNNEGGRQGTSP
jgi:hypothetical protein